MNNQIGKQKQEVMASALILGKKLETITALDCSEMIVYNPLQYAFEPFRQYVELYGGAPKEVVFVGMNPGPWGMVQTGVPFGDVSMVRDWLGIVADVGKPPVEHPKRPVLGFRCGRGEGSGKRLWGWAKKRWGEPRRFFARFFVLNYCPVAFFEGPNGTNVTPDKLRGKVREELFGHCDQSLRRSILALEAVWALGLGNFAAERVGEALRGTKVKTGRILHPSPASPAANRGWAEAVEGEMKRLGIKLD